MAKYKYRMGNGLAISPEKDMQMFAEMSAKGWHLKENLGLWFRFAKGEPHRYIYALNMDEDTDETMYETYAQCGWTAVIKDKGLHIFRAEEGTPPIFSDAESKCEVLEKERRKFGICAIVWGIITVILLIVTVMTGSWIPMIFTLICLTNTIFALFPFLALRRQISAERKKEEHDD